MEYIMGTVARDGSIINGSGFEVNIYEKYEKGAVYAIKLSRGAIDDYLLFAQQAGGSDSCTVGQLSGDVKYVNCPNGGVIPTAAVFSFIAIKL